MTAKFLNDTGINPALEEDREKESETDILTDDNICEASSSILWCWHVPVTQSTYAKLTTASL